MGLETPGIIKHMSENKLKMPYTKPFFLHLISHFNYLNFFVLRSFQLLFQRALY